LRTAVLSDRESLVALIPQWDALTERDPRTTPYDSGSLMIGLGDLFSSLGAPHIVVAWSEKGTLAGVLPLRRVPASGRLGGQSLVGYTTWHTSYFDSTVDPAIPEAGEALIAAVLARRDWDWCDLRYLLPDGNLARSVSGAREEYDTTSLIVRRVAFQRRNRGETVVSHKAARRLARQGDVVFTPAEPPDCVDAIIGTFTTMHSKRWGASGGAAEFAAPSQPAQLARVIHEAARSGLARVGTLRLSGAIIAVHIAFRFRGIQYSWRMAHDEQWNALSPGRHLFSLMIEDAFEGGCDAYDFGRGNERYKHLWPTEVRPLARLILPGQSWRAQLSTLRTRFRTR